MFSALVMIADIRCSYAAQSVGEFIQSPCAVGVSIITFEA
jgi:hypothetical protein